MVLIHGFRGTTIWKAFVLNALATSITIVFALEIKARFDTYVDEDGRTIREVTNVKSVVLTFAVTFTATLVAYFLLHVLFGYGTGQLANPSISN